MKTHLGEIQNELEMTPNLTDEPYPGEVRAEAGGHDARAGEDDARAEGGVRAAEGGAPQAAVAGR